MSFPAFLDTISCSSPSNSSPYICEIDDLLSLFKNNYKHDLVENLDSIVKEISKLIGNPIAAIIGGSILDNKIKKPKDIDVVVFYVQNSQTNNIESGSSERIMQKAAENSIDLKLFPFDYSPIFTLKMCSFYTHLFSSSREPQNSKGCILLDLTDNND